VPRHHDSNERKASAGANQQHQQAQQYSQQRTSQWQQPQQQLQAKQTLSQNHIKANAANASSDGNDQGSVDRDMKEVLINIKFNGVPVKATIDTGSSATIVKGSLWKRINTKKVRLQDSPFDFTSCSPDEKLEISGYAMCENSSHRDR
jgi:predicted aspartyl protease